MSGSGFGRDAEERGLQRGCAESLDNNGCFVNCLRPMNENDYFLLFLSNVCIFPFKAAVSCLIKEYWPVLQILTDLADPPGTSFCGRVLEQVCL